MTRDQEAIERVRSDGRWKALAIGPDRELKIAFLIRGDDWRPLRAPWWHGKDVSIIGADLNGNFILRHCDGSVRLWDHSKQTDEVIASGVMEFCSRLGTQLGQHKNQPSAGAQMQTAQKWLFSQ
ncbi:MULTISPECIES: hypothetical protein [Bradyrhizobium]|uniref:hypothetical protein n=1 Tax=Bradyrhizobium TaxID=374 RepID=UPI001144CDF8|nr:MULTISPECIES: hypothetical protein [Bradyrhizobium]QOG17821.1 hypothetical protein FOM02_11200 [Bradyrhizobium sp. SEMIA]UFW45600.1 hypothetical protein BaraCB756_25095 [Bradyrhizobium arachidis]